MSNPVVGNNIGCVFAKASEEQAIAALAAVFEVVTFPADRGSNPADAESFIAAAGQLYFDPPLRVTPADLPVIDPEGLARALGNNRELRHHVSKLLAVAALADATVDESRMRRVVEYAQHLNISSGWVRDLALIGQGQLEQATQDIISTNVRTWPGLGPLDGSFPVLLPYKDQTPEDRALAQKFAELDDYEAHTFGRQFLHHFRTHGFSLPGEPDALTGWFAVRHDSLHVLSGYSTSLQGEVCVSAFTAGMHPHESMRGHILAVIFQYHVGQDSSGLGAQKGGLDPEKFFVAWDRGRQLRVDALDSSWDFWAAAQKPVAELRDEMGIPDLAPQYAASGPEITVAENITADPLS